MGRVRITQQSPKLTVAYEEDTDTRPNMRRIGIIGHVAPEGMEVDWEKTLEDGVHVDYGDSDEGKGVPVGIMLDLQYREARA